MICFDFCGRRTEKPSGVTQEKPCRGQNIENEPPSGTVPSVGMQNQSEGDCTGFNSTTKMKKRNQGEQIFPPPPILEAKEK